MREFHRVQRSPDNSSLQHSEEPGTLETSDAFDPGVAALGSGMAQYGEDLHVTFPNSSAEKSLSDMGSFKMLGRAGVNLDNNPLKHGNAPHALLLSVARFIPGPHGESCWENTASQTAIRSLGFATANHFLPITPPFAHGDGPSADPAPSLRRACGDFR